MVKVGRVHSGLARRQTRWVGVSFGCWKEYLAGAEEPKDAFLAVVEVKGLLGKMSIRTKGIREQQKTEDKNMANKPVKYTGVKKT